jgi:hypothetical protein
MELPDSVMWRSLKTCVVVRGSERNDHLLDALLSRQHIKPVPDQGVFYDRIFLKKYA